MQILHFVLILVEQIPVVSSNHRDVKLVVGVFETYMIRNLMKISWLFNSVRGVWAILDWLLIGSVTYHFKHGT